MKKKFNGAVAQEKFSRWRKNAKQVARLGGYSRVSLPFSWRLVRRALLTTHDIFDTSVFTKSKIVLLILQVCDFTPLTLDEISQSE